MATRTNDDNTPVGQGAEHEIIRGAAKIGRYCGGVPERTAQHLLKNGKIPGFLIGGVWCTFAATLDAWLAELNDNSLRRVFRGGADG